jgi:hypothetical protein
MTFTCTLPTSHHPRETLTFPADNQKQSIRTPCPSKHHARILVKPEHHVRPIPHLRLLQILPAREPLAKLRMAEDPDRALLDHVVELGVGRDGHLVWVLARVGGKVCRGEGRPWVERRGEEGGIVERSVELLVGRFREGGWDGLEEVVHVEGFVKVWEVEVEKERERGGEEGWT